MRNNVYSDIFWYGDMILSVWAKNQNFSKFHIQYIWKIVRAWHHQLAHLNIHKELVKKCFLKKCEISKCHNSLISYPIFIIFAPIYREIFILSFEFKVILDWTSPLTFTSLACINELGSLYEVDIQAVNYILYIKM